MRLRGWRKKVTTDKQLRAKELQSREKLWAVIELHVLRVKAKFRKGRMRKK